MVPFESLSAVSTVTVAPSCTISEIKRDSGQKLQFLHTLPAVDVPVNKVVSVGMLP